VPADRFVSKHELNYTLDRPIACVVWSGGLILDSRQAKGAEECPMIANGRCWSRLQQSPTLRAAMTIDAPESPTRVTLPCHRSIVAPSASEKLHESRPLHSTPTSNSVSPVSALLVRCVRRALQRSKSFYPVITRTIGSMADVLSRMGI